MWTANAATVSPSGDTPDKRIHFTPANLISKFHRGIEPEGTAAILKATFNNKDHFVHHPHLPSSHYFGDEGAANHTRLCTDYTDSGIELFVYGCHAFNSNFQAPKKFPARHTYEACQAVARLHGLKDDSVVYIQQNPDTIDKGVFHNDVIAVGNQNLLFYHQEAFCNTQQIIAEITDKFGEHPLYFVEVPSEKISVEEAVSTYLFNTQIIQLPLGDMAIIAPTECQENSRVSAYLDELVQQNTPIKQVLYFDVKQSMKNGGGPACLRLRVAMNDKELAAVNPNTLITEQKFQQLNQWVETHYRDQLSADDLRDPQLLIESRTALDVLTQLLGLGSIYPFQCN
jgi:succinylarginine dihydrolase